MFVFRPFQKAVDLREPSRFGTLTFAKVGSGPRNFMLFRGAGHIVAMSRSVGPRNAEGRPGFITHPSRCLVYSRKIWAVPPVLLYMDCSIAIKVDE